ncbi:MAG: DUF2953 domain-containing protein [Gammaproteobacteria bacterium]|nr:DUF2953 domain-containing protein [Gammaproteobacteria bacterium]
MDTVLLTIAILLALLLALLAVPLSMSFSITREQALQGDARFRWLFGLVKFQAHFPGEAPALKHEKKPPAEKKASRKASNNTPDVAALFKHSAFRPHLMKFIKHLLRASHAEDLYLRLRIGLGDPADTGMLWIVMGPLSAMMKNLHSIHIDIEPEFIEAVIEIESHGRFQLIPLQFIALSTAFILSPTTLRAWRVMQKAKQ